MLSPLRTMSGDYRTRLQTQKREYMDMDIDYVLVEKHIMRPFDAVHIVANPKSDQGHAANERSIGHIL